MFGPDDIEVPAGSFVLNTPPDPNNGDPATAPYGGLWMTDSVNLHGASAKSTHIIDPDHAIAIDVATDNQVVVSVSHLSLQPESDPGFGFGVVEGIGSGPEGSGSDLTIDDVVINGFQGSGRDPGAGAAIYSTGSLTVENSTIANNTSWFGPAVYQRFGEALLENSTLSGNVAVYGGFSAEYQFALMTLMGVTDVVSQPPSGVASVAFEQTLASTHSEGNLAINNYPGQPCSITSSPDGGYLYARGDCVGDNGIVMSLADNGGETQTYALLPSSPARDAWVGDACPATDQRGIVRPQGAACDMGSFELVTNLPTRSPSPTPTQSPEPTATPSATPVVSHGPLGDSNCNGKIDIQDPLTELYNIVNIVRQGACIGPGDADCDGDFDVEDVLRILAYIAGVPEVQPTGCSAIGTWPSP